MIYFHLKLQVVEQIMFRNCVFLEKQLLNITQKLSGGSTPVLYLILGDSAFNLQPYLLNPFPHASIMNNMLHRVFKYRLSRVRRIVENAFGITGNIFRV